MGTSQWRDLDAARAARTAAITRKQSPGHHEPLTCREGKAPSCPSPFPLKPTIPV